MATTLAKHGVRSLSLIDPDILELHNLDAMDAVTKRDLGRFKVEAIAENLERDLPQAQIAALPQSVMTAEARRLVKTADWLVCSVDDAARLMTGALTCCYTKPLLDIGTGIFNEKSHQPSAISNPQSAIRNRMMGAEVRLILPGDGCLLCWGGVANPQEALRRLEAVLQTNGTARQPRRPWYEERAGSLRSLNATAAHVGIRLLEDLVAGRLTRSVWLRLEVDEQGLPSLQPLPGRLLPTCALCALLGRGDLLNREIAITP